MKDDDDKSFSAGFYAAAAKTLALKATATLGYFLKWWFRFPVRFFRPYAISPFMILNALAETKGSKPSIKFIKTLVADEGFFFLQRNMLPLVLANGAAGIVLFNTFTFTNHLLVKNDKKQLHYQQFASGALAGAAHSVLSAPLDRISATIPTEEILNRKGGVLRVTFNAIKKSLDSQTSVFRFLYRDFKFNLARDCIGFGLFFGVFDYSKHILKAHERKSISSSFAILTSGAIAGICFQLVSFPIERLKDSFEWKRISQLYSGIAPTLVRSMPPSAIGLLVYDFCTNHGPEIFGI